MQTYWVERLFDGDQFLDRVKLTIAEGRIQTVTPNASAKGHSCFNGLLVPGFIDLQVNGAGGVLVCQAPNVNTIDTMVQVYRQYGTTNLLPTLITSDWPTQLAAAEAVEEYLSQGKSGVLGVHFEGPHLAGNKAGIHNAERFVALTDKHLALYTRKTLGKVMITLAPEAVPNDVIRDLTQQGVIVSLGHTNAEYDQVCAALAAGARSMTHLFNAMSPLASRVPGAVGAALSSDQAFAGIIVDGHHVHPASVKIAVRALSPDRAYLVSDAMAHVGSDQQTLPFEQHEIVQSQGKLSLADGRLAGSVLTLNSAVKNCHLTAGIELAGALKMATGTPARCLGVDQTLGKIKSNYRADMTLIDEQFNVLAVWQNGQLVKITY